MCNSIGDVAHQLIRNILNGASHNVRRIDCTDDAAPLERSFAVLNSRGLEIRNHGEILPHFTFHTEVIKQNG